MRLINIWEIFMLFCMSNCIYIGPYYKAKRDQMYWERIAAEDLSKAMFRVREAKIAKNIIIFIGNGLGPETVTAARIYGVSENDYLSFEKFPYMGMLKTYSANKMVPDCSSAATAIFCGAKANDGTVGVNLLVQQGDCIGSLNTKNHLSSVFVYAQTIGKSTGFVTTSRVTSGSVAALYAHSANDKWECEAKIPRRSRRCKDIAKQLIEDEPGKNIKVIMGGGRQCLRSNLAGSEADPLDKRACYSKDGRDLMRQWKIDKNYRQVTHAVINNNLDLDRLDVNTDYVLGIFANSHFRYDYERERGSYGPPSLIKMTEKAIEVLRKNDNGFLLVVEHGLIDLAHHEGHARVALDEAVVFSNTVEKTIELLQEYNALEETLLIVTSDHAHSMIMTGYPSRGHNILSIAQSSPIDSINYTTLIYATGGAKNIQFSTNNTNQTTVVQLSPFHSKTSKHATKIKEITCPPQQIIRRDPSKNNTEDFSYFQQAFVLTNEVYHAGTDVIVYARGPMAHIIGKTQDQTFLYYLLTYATDIPEGKKLSFEVDNSGQCSVKQNYGLMFVFISSVLLIFKLFC